MGFSWADPKSVDNSGLRVAAINPETLMIAHIYDNVIGAAKALAPHAVQSSARQIGTALNIFHKKVLGYYWKRVI